MNDDERKRLEEQGVVFYYSREERLKRMPENAKLYNGELLRKRGFLRVLLDSPGGKYMIFVIILLIGIIVSLSVFYKSNENTVGGIAASVKAFAFEDKIYVNLKLDKNIDSEKAAVTAEIKAVNNDDIVVETKTLKESYTGEELVLRTTFSDFEIKKIEASIIINGDEKTISTVIER
ncbi:MAG: hypothetical protein GX297_06710 [Treponema sp.]|nr:hypothetical protein [Treponema sp.]